MWQVRNATGVPTFFESNIRNYEYEAIINIAMEALDYDDIVLINAPFTREIRNPEYMDQFRKRLAMKNARLEIIWVVTAPEICHQRMIHRNSSRDTWKLENWDKYISGVDFRFLQPLTGRTALTMIFFYSITRPIRNTRNL